MLMSVPKNEYPKDTQPTDEEDYDVDEKEKNIYKKSDLIDIFTIHVFFSYEGFSVFMTKIAADFPQKKKEFWWILRNYISKFCNVIWNLHFSATDVEMSQNAK